MKTIAIWVTIVFFGAILIGAVWYFAFAPKETPQTPAQNGTLPISGSVDVNNPSSVSSTTSTISIMQIAANDGSVVSVNDFIRSGTTIPDTANAGRYLLAGNLGYCLSDPQKCQAGSSTDFNIYYDSEQQTFSTDLTAEPIGEVRLKMEQFLLVALGITEQQMCSLKYYVGVTIYVNSQFAGKNLGFSFCPGATVLPK